MSKFFSFLFTGLVAVVALSSFNFSSFSTIKQDSTFEIPDNINAIFKQSCFGCHNSDSKNTKAKDKMMIDKLTSLKKSKLASKLNKIVKELKEGEMPPEKFAAKHPERVPSKADKNTLIEWAKEAKSDL